MKLIIQIVTYSKIQRSFHPINPKLWQTKIPITLTIATVDELFRIRLEIS